MAVASQEGHPEAGVGLRVKEGGLLRGKQQVLQLGLGENPGVRGYPAAASPGARLNSGARIMAPLFLPGPLRGLEPHPEIAGAVQHLHQVRLGQELDVGVGLNPGDQILQFRPKGWAGAAPGSKGDSAGPG